MTGHSDYYVYILFDALGVERYVGKGRKNRWLQHENRKEFKQTIKLLGRIPKIKVHENLTERIAYKLEHELIKIIGRQPNGPLFNCTDKGSGPNSEQVKLWHASRSAEERSATLRKTAASMTAKERSAHRRRNALAQGREALSLRIKAYQASLTPEQRYATARKAGLASAAAKSPQERKKLMAKAKRIYMKTTTLEERQIVAKRTGVGMATRDQLSQWGKKGATVHNSRSTQRQKRIWARKGALTAHSHRTPEERRVFNQKGGLAAQKALMAKTPEERSASMKKAWKTRRKLGKTVAPSFKGFWITNGKTRKRLAKRKSLPKGWKFGWRLNVI